MKCHDELSASSTSTSCEVEVILGRHGHKLRSQFLQFLYLLTATDRNPSSGLENGWTDDKTPLYIVKWGLS